MKFYKINRDHFAPVYISECLHVCIQLTSRHMSVKLNDNPINISHTLNQCLYRHFPFHGRYYLVTLFCAIVYIIESG